MENNPTAAGQKVQQQRRMASREGYGVPTSRVYPKIYGGVCEKCGVVDDQSPVDYQYKLCEHFRGLSEEVRCWYCDATRQTKDVIKISELKVFDHPTKRDEYGQPLLVARCDSFTCTDQFLKEFGS